MASILEQDHLPGKSERSLGGTAEEQKGGWKGTCLPSPKHIMRDAPPGKVALAGPGWGGLKTSSETHVTLRALNKPADGQTGMAAYLEQRLGRIGGVWASRTRGRKRAGRLLPWPEGAEKSTNPPFGVGGC